MFRRNEVASVTLAKNSKLSLKGRILCGALIPAGIPTNALSCATCDPDGDGLNNLAEFLANTSPTDAGSTFRCTTWSAARNLRRPPDGPAFPGRDRTPAGCHSSLIGR